jgi:multidrug transporter EmrE-like cation transporter
MGFSDIVLLSVVEIFGDFNLRWYAQSNQLSYLGYGIAGYIGVIYYLIKSLRSDNVLYVNGMWDGVSGLIESVAAYVVLGDRLEKPQQYFGLMLVIVGIYLLKHDGK